MKDDKVVSKLMESSRIKNIGIKRELLDSIIRDYNNILLQNLLENGRIELGNGMIIEVVKLLDRVHVLRGTTYKSSRKYKLKLTMEEDLYKKIEDYYDQLQEDIM